MWQFFTILWLVSPLVWGLENDPYHHEYILDHGSSYRLHWTVDWPSRQVTFNITAKTKGYLGFGLALTPGMNGADLVIAGVSPRGKPYLQDMHGASVGNQVIPDSSQDYLLLSAWENSTHTSVLFSRAFDTCDENDVKINDDSVVVLWAIGENDDNKLYHYRKRGTFNANLLDPDYTPRAIHNAAENFRRRPTEDELGELEIWTVSRRQLVPALETAYWCSFQKGPEIQKRHHLVGYNFRWETQEQFMHSHHMIFLRCRVPEGRNAEEFFGPLVKNSTGEMCYFPQTQQAGGLPTQYCREVVYGYAIGLRVTFVPEDLGLSIDPGDFFLLQVHYDNPRRRDDLEYTINLDFYLTPNLRRNEFGVMTVGHQIPGSPSLIIPPFSPEHMIYGHCGVQCTSEMYPPEGIKVIAVQMHTHSSGRKARVRHFRGKTERPWLANDDNYNNQFQAVRSLRNEVRVLPGDHLMVQCTYDNVWANGSVVGGFHTRQEMCLVYLWYYNKVDYSLCRSQIIDEDYNWRWLGSRNFTWSEDLEKLENVDQNGRTVSELANAREWTLQERESLQRDQREIIQVNGCNREDEEGNSGSDDEVKVAGYPSGIKEWEMSPSQCRTNELR